MRPRGYRYRYLQTVTAALTSDRGVLGLLTANDLFWRTIADVPAVAIQRYVETVSEGIVAPAILSFLTAHSTEFQTLALAAQWLFILSLFYVLTPKVFRGEANEIARDRQFRLVTAVAALGFALVVAAVILNSPRPLDDTLYYVGSLGAVGLSLGSYGWYFRAVRGWRDRPIERRIDLLDRFVPVPDRDRAELEASSRANDPWSRVRVGSIFPALLFVCTISAFFLGLLAVLLLGLYPLGEVLVLASVGLNAIADRYGIPFGIEPPHQYTLDIESRLTDVLADTEANIKAWTTVILVLVGGLGFQVIGFVYAFPFVRTETIPFLLMAVDTGIASTYSFVLVWNTVGMGICLLAAVLFGIWYWLRVFERVPAFLAAWQASVDGRGRTRLDTDGNRTSSVTRPIGLMGPPALLFLITVLWAAFSGKRDLSLTTPDIAYAFAWPLSMVLLVVTVWRTAKKPPQPPYTDAIAIPLSLMIQFVGELAFLWIENIGTDRPLALAFSPFATFVVLSIPWLFFFEDVRRWTRDRAGESEYPVAAYLGLYGVVVTSIGALASGRWGLEFVLFGSVVVVLSGVLALDEYYSMDVD